MISKLDWKEQDFFEVEDWQRLHANYTEIWDRIMSFGMDIAENKKHVVNASDTLSLPYYDDVNTLEAAIEYIYDSQAYRPEDWEPTKTWVFRTSSTYPEIGNPSHNDFNRWEHALFEFYSMLERMSQTFIPCGEALAGEDNL